MFLSKSDEETTANRKLAKELVDKWVCLCQQNSVIFFLVKCHFAFMNPCFVMMSYYYCFKKQSRPIFNKSTRFEDMRRYDDERAPYRRPQMRKCVNAFISH